MSRGNENARRLFGKEVYQSPAFTRDMLALGPETAELVILVTVHHYPRFRRLKHGLILGELSAALQKDYEGPALQFIYKLLPSKAFFACLKVGGFSQADLDAIEAHYDL